MVEGGYDDNWRGSADPHDPSIPATSPLYFNGAATPGDYVAPTGSRKLSFAWTVGTFSVLITHADVTLGSEVLGVYGGNSTLSPEPDKRFSCRAVAGGIIAQVSSGAGVAITRGFVTIEVIA